MTQEVTGSYGLGVPEKLTSYQKRVLENDALRKLLAVQADPENVEKRLELHDVYDRLMASENTVAGAIEKAMTRGAVAPVGTAGFFSKASAEVRKSAAEETEINDHSTTVSKRVNAAASDLPGLGAEPKKGFSSDA